MLAVGARANLVSLVYLLVFCYGVVQSFQSRAVTLLTLAVAVVACVCHGAVRAVYGDDDSYAGADVAKLFGFRPMHNSTEYLQGVGVDVLVLACSAIHYWYVLRRLNSRSREQEEEERAQQHFDLFEMGEQLINRSEPKRDRRRSMLRAVELLSAVLLFLTSVSVPAFATGVLYLLLLLRLIGYTVFVRRMTVQELVSRKSGVKFSSYFLGPGVTNVLLGLCLIIIVAWYATLLSCNDVLTENDTVQTVAKYAGFANFREGGVRWQYYFFAGFLFLLFVSCAKLHNLHSEVKEADARRRNSLASGFSQDAGPTVDLGSVNADVARSLLDPLDDRNRAQTADIKDLLSKQSIVVRAFARDGGLLLGSAAAIVWCVSYPSYLSAPFLGLAFVTIASFGLLSSSIFMWMLIAYGTLLALAEYTANLTIDFLSDDYTTSGLRVFDYPFLDIGAHTLCLVFMFLSIRTQWRYQDILRESRKRRNTAKVSGADEDNDPVAEGDRASFANFQRLARMRSLVIYVANSEAIEERLKTKGHVRQNPLFFVSRLAVEIDNWFRICGVLLSYTAFIVVALQFESGPTKLSTNMIGAVQLALFLVIFGNHLGGFQTSPRTSLRLKVLWSFALLVEVIILVARYVYQFEEVSTYLEEHFFTTSFISAQDFGLEYHASNSGISDVFVYLLPSAVMMGLCFWQLSSMMKDITPYDFFTAGRSRAADCIRFFMETVQHLLISFSATALVIVTMWVALDQISFVGWLYILVLIAGRALSDSWKQLWFPLFWLASLSILLKYLIQLSTFNTEQTSSDVLFKPGDDSDWVGMIRLDERYKTSAGKPALWDLLSGEFLIILMCVLQRMAQYFDSSSSARRQAELEELTARFEEQYALYAANNLDSYHPTSSCEVDDDEDDLKDRARAFTYDDDDIAPTRSRKTKAFPESEADNKRGDHSPLSSISSQDKDFFSCLRSFGTTYASKASVNVVMLLLTVSCFVHQDIIAMIYLLIVYSMMYAYPTTVCRRWWALAWLLSLVIVLEYSVMLWFPPFLGINMEETFPWRAISDTYEKWLVMSNQHKWALMADFVALLSVYLLPDSNKVSEDEEVITVVDESASTLKLHHDDGLVEEGTENANKPFAMSSGEVTYVLLMRKYVWYYVEFVFLANWLPLLLLLVFVFGAKQGGAVSIAYLLGALVMLYRLDEARDPLNPWIQYLRKWNWGHLFVITLINAPYVYAALSNCLIGTKSGDDDSCTSIANFLGVEANKVPYGLIALFVLISIQCEILAAPTYHTILTILLSEQNRASARREEIVRDFYRRRTEQWYAMKKDKNAAIQRLKIIVSKLVHKVEELMDIALGLHHNLPPMAPSKPVAVERTQNSATISWEKPSGSYHKIRYYRISRQQFPSLTLLGDFGDIVEITGDHCEARIEGLRPGTSYQFKVCAVSRMGEGPFSVASDPIATYPLNLDGSTTAGWMKYRREKLPAPRFGFLISWMKAKYLHRYVVIDSSHLVFYQDEERALKHRSRKHRKRLKTSFKWRDVISLRLSDSKVQYDDMSPSLYCFEIVVRHAGSRGDVKYVFQSELSKEFNMFLSALAFSVPRETLDESTIECLKERNLPNPLDIAPPSHLGDDDPNYDENKSEWSSVTGDESTLGDPEDEEFDDKSGFTWRIPLYRLLYDFQNAGFKLETTQYEEDDLNEPSLAEIAQLVINGVRSKSATVAATNAKSIQPMVLFGLYKFDGIAIKDVTSVYGGLQWDFYIMLFLLWHQRELRLQGFWVEAHGGDIVDDQASSRYKSEVMRGLRTSFSSSHDSIDDAFLYDGPVTAKKLERPRSSRSLFRAQPSFTSQRSSRSLPIVERAATNASVVSMDNADICNEVAAQVLQELREQEKLEAEKKAAEKAALAAAPDSGTSVAHSPTRQSIDYDTAAAAAGPCSPRAGGDNVVSKQVDMDADESEVGFHARAKESWLEKKYPKVHAYFQTVICKPPAQWDKDIQVAITGEKPGRDFYTASLSVLLFSSIYAVIFYEELGEADSSSTSVADANSRVSSSSLLSGYLVLLVLIELIFIIWDRVAYVCSSLQSKVILQYSYTFVLHMTVWYFLPSNTNIYFQQRPALVVFYLFQCVYLWLGALQIRYGYPVYLGSRYNYTEETKVTAISETLFGLMMQAPFLFEMRALLDYMCTKTSLSWQHWVLLEDTAAHLFGVKGEMKGRVEQAEILQGKKRQPMKKKLTSAGVMLLFLLICLVGPLAMFSSINPSTTANEVTLTTVTFGIVDEQETMNQLYSNSDSNSPSCKVDLNTDSASVQCVEFDVFSTNVWALSPPRMDLLVTQLQSTQVLNWTIAFTFTRPGPTDDEVISATYSVKMTDEHRNALIPMIKQTVSDDESTTLSSIQVDSLFPAVVQLTANSGVLRRSTEMRSVAITKHSSDGSTWWTIEPVLGSTGTNYCSAAYPFCIVAVSDRIVQGLTTLGISSYGLTAVYVFVVVTVGSAVKGFFRGKLFQIQYEELPDPEDVLELVEGIYIARQENYVGHLKDEVRIFETLIRVLRSPETLIKVTGTNVIHIPTAKEKLD
ncbi:unnamed protein product [Phytophthora lilii]|uniref:Unnamed protein product n=1 Tax=Phytophthora lilii TaxID=2077276 RepID=A0A9W6XCT7_9STRA|nr:unnamed protein product [Phytophthora lilii]